jgi:PAS domain S-box-containing protein
MAPPESPSSRRTPGLHGERMWRRLSPAVIAVAYVTLGLLWIVVSDLLLATAGAEAMVVNLSLTKGVGFVLVTGSLLFVMLDRRERWLAAADTGLSRWLDGGAPESSTELRVVLVEPDRHSRTLIGRILRLVPGIEIEVQEAATLAEGHQLVSKGSHDAIVVGDGGGADAMAGFVRDVQALAAGPVIVVSSTADPRVRRQALGAGAHEYLTRGQLDPDGLGRTLRHSAAYWQVRHELTRTQQWYAEMVNEAPVGLFRSTPAGDLLEANQALADIFGAATADEIKRYRVSGLYANPEVRRHLLARLEAGETIDDVDVPMLQVDGSPIVVRIRMRGLMDSGGLRLLYGALTDVTGERAREAWIGLQASMLDQVRNAVIATDFDGRVTYWNSWAETQFGWTKEETLGQSVIDVTSPTHEVERAEQIMASLFEGEMWEGEYECQRKDGTTFPAFVSDIVIRDDDGEPAGILGVVVDLTEIRRAEGRAATQAAMATSVLESVQFAACVLDDEGTIIAVNGAWRQNARKHGADPARVGVGADYLAVCDRAAIPDAVTVAAGMRSVLRRETPRFSHEYPCGASWFRVEVSPSVRPMNGAVVMHIDITDLRRETERAEEFARAKDRLIASVSHELRTPLTAVLGFADLIENPDHLDPAELGQLASEIHRQATDMAAIVEDLLVSARAEIGSLTIRSESVDPVSEIEGVLSHLSPSTPMTIEKHLEPVPQVWVDPLRFRQILRNLVTNALRYGGSRVRIGTGVDGDEVAIRVADDGEGVPPDLAEAIFEPFFSAHDRSGQPDALGLGLSVVKTLTEAMGGSVTLGGENGWTVFTVRLPTSPDEVRRS